MVRAGLRVKGLGNPKGPAIAVERGKHSNLHPPHTQLPAPNPHPVRIGEQDSFHFQSEDIYLVRGAQVSPLPCVLSSKKPGSPEL